MSDVEEITTTRPIIYNNSLKVKCPRFPQGRSLEFCSQVCHWYRGCSFTAVKCAYSSARATKGVHADEIPESDAGTPPNEN